MFPKIVVPPNHPFLVGFSIINHPFWGTTIFGNTHICLHDWELWWRLYKYEGHDISILPVFVIGSSVQQQKQDITAIIWSTTPPNRKLRATTMQYQGIVCPNFHLIHPVQKTHPKKSQKNVQHLKSRIGTLAHSFVNHQPLQKRLQKAPSLDPRISSLQVHGGIIFKGV